MSARIVIISGASGTGKTSVSRMLAGHSALNRAVHIHTDDFYEYIQKGYISPWENGSGDQNETVVEAAAASAKRFFEGGYEVFVDGVIGPWFLKPWIKISEEGTDVRYVILRPDEQTTIARVAGREQNEAFPLNAEIVSGIWRSLADVGEYESHVVDTTAQTVHESASLIQKLLQEGAFRIT